VKQFLKDPRWVVLWCFIAITGLFLYNLFPRSSDLIYPFPFHSQGLTRQTYVDYLGSRFSMSCLFWTLFIYSPRYKGQLFLFWLLSVGYLVDYLLIYNDPFAMLKGVPISYTYFMLLLSGWILYRTFKEPITP
jgi:hypothetical protein